MDSEALLTNILFFVNMRLEDVAEAPSRLLRAQELIRTDIAKVLADAEKEEKKRVP